MGIVSPLGAEASAHWEGLVAGRCAVSRLERLTRLGFPVDVAAEVPAATMASCLPRLSRKQLKLYNRATVFAMVAALSAAEEAKLTVPVSVPTRAGVILATLFIPYPIQNLLGLLPGLATQGDTWRPDMRRTLQACMTSVNPLDVSLKVLPNLTAGHIAIHCGLQGACRTVSDTSTGGLHAIAQAAMAIREGDLDVVLCGGAECPLEDLVFADLCQADLLASPCEESEKTCRPFGRRRAGRVAGEGAAMLVLEALDHAERRGAPIRAEIVGFGAAVGDGSAAGERKSCRRAIDAALADAARESVDLVSANGDATRINDLAEAATLRDVLHGARNHSAIYATKGAHGDLFSAAGPLEVATAIMAIEHGLVPPSVNCDDPDPECGLTLSGSAVQTLPGANSALVNALGAFGEAASLVVTRGE
jgi:3-oxoacyl-[acyl-carrier-protein] synthase II